MRRETQVELIRELLDHHAAGTTQLADDMLALPAEVYTSEAHWQAEQEALFRRRPVMACLSGAVASAGDYVSLTVGGVPLVVVRGDDGRLRVLSNVCRHRGMPVASGRGATQHLQCPYHAWTYDLRGRLLRAPLLEGRDDFDQANCALPAVATTSIDQAS